MTDYLSTSHVKVQHIKQHQQMIVNGQPFEQILNIPQAICKECGRLLAQFEPNTPLPVVYDHLREQISNDLRYCPTCGKKLLYHHLIIIDAEKPE